MAFKIDADILDMTVEEVNDIINKIMAETVEEELIVSEEELKEQAIKFLSAVDKLERDAALFEETALKFVAFKGDPESTEYEEEKANAFEKSILQQEYLLANNFEKYLSAYREEMKRSAIYVTVDRKGKITGSYEIPMKEMITYTNKEGGFLAGQLGLSNRQSLEEKGLFDDMHIEEARKAYEGVYNRLERYYEIHNGPDDKKLSGLLLWKETSEWKVGRVANYGDLKEAYISFLFDNHGNQLCKLANGSNPPYHKHSFVGNFFKKYVNNVTNLAAIVEEDVKSKKFNKQYAVKGSGAHLPSLDQYIELANTIAQLSKPEKTINKTWIEKKIKEQNPSNAKRNIEMSLTDLTEKELEILTKDFNKNLTK